MSTSPRTAQAPTATTIDPRAAAFCSPDGPEIFTPVAHTNDIWRPDPFDVETIHDDARDAFQRLVARAGMTPKPTAGKILLLKGESGSGKTHLMRAFRNWVHEGRRGYCGYMQMTSSAEDYPQYILHNLIESLSHPYYQPEGETTGLMRLSTALAEACPGIAPERLNDLREGNLDTDCLARLVDAMADQVIMDERFDDFDFDLVRALLYLQCDDPKLRPHVLKYLRCEDLSKTDRDKLGGLTPRTYAGAAARVVAKLGQLVGSVESVPLILCLDQLEDIYNLENAPVRFRRAMAAVCEMADKVPSAVVVVSCLEDMYLALSDHLVQSVKFRIEHDPSPIQLSVKRDTYEVAQVIGRRLEALYDAQGIESVPADPTYPIPASALAALAELPTRYVLDLCGKFRERCIAAGKVVEWGDKTDKPDPGPEPKPKPDLISIEQLWNDFKIKSQILPGDDDSLTRLLGWAISACSDEAGDGHHFSAEADGTTVDVTSEAADQSVERLLVGLCDKSAKGGALGKQVTEIEKKTGNATPAVIPVIVRSTEFPTSPSAVITRQIGNLIARGGRRVVVQDADWRAMMAMQKFREAQKGHAGLSVWLVAEKPMSRLDSLRKILALDDRKPRTPPLKPKVDDPIEPPVKPKPTVTEAPTIPVGFTTGLRVEPVTVNPADLKMHAAFLGATGSGKTTVALSIVEQLLIQGIPAILVDRKGDLCRYADPEAWTSPLDEAMTARRAMLRDRVDVAVYTPGNASGRPLTIAPVPPGLGRLSTADRKETASQAASALGAMMGFKPVGDDQARKAILANAIDLLSQYRPDEVPTLEHLIEFIDGEDPTLVNAIGRLDPKHFHTLVQKLEVVRLSKGNLLTAEGEPMAAESLLGLGRHGKPGKTRLSIISTKFLGSNEDIQFWAARFLIEMAAWTSRAPSDSLQAVILFDEADLYLPAVGKPASKPPMESLLKRARSAGLGLFLATQSPGDFDYKCRENVRSWFVGRVTETRALGKLKPMFSESGLDAESRLPGQTTGQFHLLREGKATAFRADRSIVETDQLSEDEILALARETI